MSKIDYTSPEYRAQLLAEAAEQEAMKRANLTEHVAVHNRMVEALNTYIPKFIEELKLGFKLRVNGDFYEKDKARFKNLEYELIKEFGFTDKYARVSFTKSHSSLVLEIKESIHHGSTPELRTSGAYFLSNYVWDLNTDTPNDNFELPYVSVEEILALKKKEEELEEKIHKLQEEANRAKLKTKYFNIHL